MKRNYSFFKLLIIDDNIDDTMISDIIENKMLHLLPIEIYGCDMFNHIDEWDKNTVPVKRLSSVNNQLSWTEKQEEVPLESFTLIFIDYDLGENVPFNGADIIEKIYQNIANKPYTFLFSNYNPFSDENIKSSIIRLTEKYRGLIEYLAKNTNGTYVRNLIYDIADEKYAIKEFYNCSIDETWNNKKEFDGISQEITNRDIVKIEVINGKIHAYDIKENDNNTKKITGKKFWISETQKDFGYALDNSEISELNKFDEVCSILMDDEEFNENYRLCYYLQHKYPLSEMRDFYFRGKEFTKKDSESKSKFWNNEWKNKKKAAFKKMRKPDDIVFSFSMEENSFTVNIVLGALSNTTNQLFYLKKVFNLVSKKHKSWEFNELIAVKLEDSKELYSIIFNKQQTNESEIISSLFQIFLLFKNLQERDLDKSISIFDLIGPVMIGPSSSHTCGANRIGRMSRKIIKYYLGKKENFLEQQWYIALSLYKSFRLTGKGHKTFNALPAGLLKDFKEDDIKIATFDYSKKSTYQINGKTVNWLSFTEEKDININALNLDENDVHSNSALIFLWSDTKNKSNKIFTGEVAWSDFELIIVGESTGGGKIQIKAIGGKDYEMFNFLVDNYSWEDRKNYFILSNKAKNNFGLLDGTNIKYKEIDRISDYPPKIKETGNPVIQLDFYNLKSLNDSKLSLLKAAYQYEAWHTGYSEADIKSSVDNRVASILEGVVESIKIPNNKKEGKEGAKSEYNHLFDLLEEVKNDYDNKNYILSASKGALVAMLNNSFSESKIVAAPTGGASGIIPGVYKGMKQYFENTRGNINNFDEKFKEGLLIAGLLAAITSNKVPPAGAALGCQAETGTGAGMGAAIAAYLLGGNKEQIINSMILAMKNTLGLVCDPIAGRVNTPCIKRNGFKAVEAITAALMSLEGIKSFVDFDEVIDAMLEIGVQMPEKYRETSQGGLAITNTGLIETIFTCEANHK